MIFTPRYYGVSVSITEQDLQELERVDANIRQRLQIYPESQRQRIWARIRAERLVKACGLDQAVDNIKRAFAEILK